MLRFREWLLVEELSVEKNTERLNVQNKEDVLSKKNVIINTIQNNPTPEKRKQAYLDFLIGFAVSKPNALPEDFQFAWDTYSSFLTNRLPEFTGVPFLLGQRTYEMASILRKKVGKNKLVKQKERGELSAGQEIEKIADQKIGTEFGEVQYTIYRLPGLSETEAKDQEKIEDRHIKLCHLGKGTEWCTAHPSGDYHRLYAKNDIYVVHRNGKPQYQLDIKNGKVDQFMDSNDNPVGVYSEYLYRMFKKVLPIRMSAVPRPYPERDDTFIDRVMIEYGDFNEKTDNMLAKVYKHYHDPDQELINYLKAVKRKVSPALEEEIAKRSSILIFYKAMLTK